MSLQPPTKAQILLIADPARKLTYALQRELSERQFPVILCRGLDEVHQRLIEPGQFSGLILVDAEGLRSDIYSFLRICREQLSCATLVLMVDKLQPSLRSYALRQGAAEVLATGSVHPHLLAEKIEALLRSASALSTDQSPPESALAPTDCVPIEIVLGGLRQISRVAEAHFSKFVVVNYWQMARETLPEVSHSLTQFLVAYNAEIQFRPARNTISPQELIAIRRWVSAFVQRCQQSAEDFPNLVDGFDSFVDEDCPPDQTHVMTSSHTICEGVVNRADLH